MNKLTVKAKKLLKNPRFFSTAKKFYFALVLLVAFSTVYHVGYAKRIIPGVRVGEVFVGGMLYEEAYKSVTEHLENLDTSIKFSHEGFSHVITGEEVGLEYDVAGSVSRAFELGRTGNSVIDIRDKMASLVKTIRVKAHYSWDDASLSSEFEQIKGEINQVALEPSFFLDENDVLSVSNPEVGKKVSNQSLYDLVIKAFDNVDFSDEEIPVDTMNPELKFSDLKEVESQVADIVAKSLRVISDDRDWLMEPKQLLDFLEVVPSNSGDAELVLNRKNFDAYIGFLSQEVNRLPRGRVSDVKDGVVVNFELLEGGSELDARAFTQDFEKALFEGNSSVQVAMTPIDSLGDTSKYGIFTLLGTGSSKYTGSAAARAHNLTLAAARTDGVLVPPGDTYSFNNSVGEISGGTGYDTAYIISNGRTVLGEGGGVCQTSTTLFRAVLDAGLPILTRFPHAYRVYYYEIDQPVGFDASIYQPSLDFQFKNDSPNYVLVQTSWNSGEQSLTFDIYGTPDGRTVEISEPAVSNYIAPPEPLYQDDDSLPKGTVKQVDFEAWGATSQFSRTVTKNNEVLHEDNFRSTYQPWRAVYLVGTN
ncbi:hypothetical protein HN803_06760 [candidate division WWE3 bacterium]|nr:hypothetical protein [candidate division WWE3 bacterium]MBT7350455.1 hypothetical protein [candidate division WWE3 bacterium]